jgi:RNA polymerase sigma-70 factor, ECF subfamily
MSDGTAVCYEQRIVRMRPRIYHLVRVRVGNCHDAEDLTQETMIRAWKSTMERPPTGCLESWVLKIANNLIIDAARRRLRRPAMSLSLLLAEDESETADCELADSSNDPAKRLWEQGIEERLELLLAGLKPRDHHLLSLLARGQSYRQIADTLNCPAGTVRSRICRMRLRLQGEIRRDG